MGLDVQQLRQHVIRPALEIVDIIVTPGAEELLVAIAAHESDGFRYIAQIHGPALGLFQMEPGTHADCWTNFIQARPGLVTKLGRIMAPLGGGAEQMTWNLMYAACMARCQLRRFVDPIPPPSDLDAIAALWKSRWNTPLGAGTVEAFKSNYAKYVGGPPV